MNASLLSIIKRITAEQGEAVLADPQRLKTFFKQYAHNEPKDQCLAFGRCIEMGCYGELKKARTADERRWMKAELARQLHSKTELALPLCADALDLLDAAVFGAIPPVAQYQQPAPSAPPIEPTTAQNKFTTEGKQEGEIVMYCTNCGKQVNDGAKFCANCGAAVNTTIRQAWQGGFQAPNAAQENASNEGKSVLSLQRPKSMSGILVKIKVCIDGKPVKELKNGETASLEVSNGKHFIHCETSAYFASRTESVEFSGNSNRISFVISFTSYGAAMMGDLRIIITKTGETPPGTL